ncbi:hypothetical protein [Amycolatopsis sp. YIM 10]|uniref:hypothetical protein n=1 Tax=Amycolatopsis sp. YIM 10 TaxID=2653857 RepID=UPI001D13765B|nr:hypothetical protein [Amycolatopsis sp. YIM 10]
MGHVADQRGEEHPGAEVEPAHRAEPAPQPPADPEQLRQFQQFQEFLKFSEAQKAQQPSGELTQQPPPGPPQQPPSGLAQQPSAELTQQPSSGFAQQPPSGPTQQTSAELAQQPPSQPGHQALPQPAHQSLPQPSHPPLPQPGQQSLPQPSQQQWLPAQQPPQPPPPARPKVPRWLKWIGKKVLGWLILLLLLALLATWAYNHFFPSDNDELPAPEAGRGTYSATELLQPNPYRAVQLVYQQIAQGLPDMACGNLSKAAQAKFAADLGFADCAQAVNQLSTEVTNKTQYSQSIPFNKSGQPPGDVVVIDSCDYEIKGGGRALGVFTVERQHTDASGGQVKGEQWLITGHEPGPNPCSGAKPSAPPSN